MNWNWRLWFGFCVGAVFLGSSWAQTIVPRRGPNWIGYVQGQPGQVPIPLTDYENNPDGRANFFAGEWTSVWKQIHSLRRPSGAPDLVEDAALGRAGFFILEEVLRQDWLGTSFPNGLTLAEILRKSGYTGDARRVQVYFYLATDNTSQYHQLFNTGRRVVQKMQAALSPSYRSYGYANIKIDSPKGYVSDGDPYDNADAGRVRATNYEIVLVSMDAPPAPTRLLADWLSTLRAHPFPRYDRIPPIQLKTKVARRMTGGIVTNPRQLGGRPAVRGRLPAGIKLNTVTGQFVGKARRTGVYRFTVTATYRQYRGEGCLGRFSTAGVIRVVR